MAVCLTWEGLGNAALDAFLVTSAVVFVASTVSLIKYIARSKPVTTAELKNQVTSDGYTMANKGHSRGALEPKNLKHQLALEQAASNPTAGREVSMKEVMQYSRWDANEGWIKMQQEFCFYQDKRVVINYVINQKIMFI